MEDALELYHLVLKVSNKFLRNANMFEIRELQDHNPTYAELAKIIRGVARLIIELADSEDPMLGQKASEYANLMTDMAQAIGDDDNKRLKECVTELNQKPGL